jgi:hypothetical protein
MLMTEAKSEYLYGDSTPAPLKTNFVAFLRDTIDFAVESLLCEALAVDAKKNASQLADTTERAIEDADRLVTQLCSALDRADLGGTDSLLGRCAAKIRAEAWNAVRSEASEARGVVAAELARAAQAETKARTVTGKALEGLLRNQEIPGATTEIRVTIEGGTRYTAHLHGHTSYGLSWDVALSIPPSHVLAQALRIDRVVERLEIEAPDETGWLHKGMKIRPQRLDRLYLTEFVRASAATMLKLRAAPDGTGMGFDVAFPGDSSVVRLERILASGVMPDTPSDVDGEDAEKLRSLRDALEMMALETAHNRQSPVAARIDGKPVLEHETPNVVIERIITDIAPLVAEIARRSLAPGELVLRRHLGENHREEVFLSKAELEKKLEPLPLALRSAFAPFNLWDLAGASPGLETPQPAAEMVAHENGERAIPRPVDTAPLPGLEKDEELEEHEPTVIVDASVYAWTVPEPSPDGTGVARLPFVPPVEAAEAPPGAPEVAAQLALPGTPQAPAPLASPRP